MPGIYVYVFGGGRSHINPTFGEWISGCARWSRTPKRAYGMRSRWSFGRREGSTDETDMNSSDAGTVRHPDSFITAGHTPRHELTFFKVHTCSEIVKHLLDQMCDGIFVGKTNPRATINFIAPMQILSLKFYRTRLILHTPPFWAAGNEIQRGGCGGGFRILSGTGQNRSRGNTRGTRDVGLSARLKGHEGLKGRGGETELNRY